MFFIRDAKGNEIGPFPAETIKQWLRERRYNCFTAARRADEDKWKMLGSFTDFSKVQLESSPQNQAASSIPSNSPPPTTPAQPTGATIPPWLMKAPSSSDSIKPTSSTQQKTPIAPQPPPLLFPETTPPSPASLRYSLPLWVKIVWGVLLGLLGLVFLGTLALSTLLGNFSQPGGILVFALIMLAVSYGLSLGCWKLFNRSQGAAAAGLLGGASIVFIAFFIIPFFGGLSRGIKEARTRREAQKQEAIVDSAVDTATNVVSRKISLKAIAYQDARDAMDFASMVSLTGINKKEDLVTRRNKLNTLLEKKNQLEQIWSNAAALMREELEKQKLSPEEIDDQIADFNKQFKTTKQESARKLEKDGQVIYSLIEMHQLLETEWGRWKIDGTHIRFENTTAMQKYNSIMQSISASSL